MLAKIGDKIELLIEVGKYKMGDTGTVTSHCGCKSLPKITVTMSDNDNIILLERNTKGYERYRVI